MAKKCGSNEHIQHKVEEFSDVESGMTGDDCGNDNEVLLETQHEVT
jgi:hypothetical protein